MNEITVVIDGDEIRFVHDDDMAEAMAMIGPSETARASNVEPVGQTWIADMGAVGGPTFEGPRRSQLIAREVEWLQENGCPFPLK